jgi:hypothetical protein
MAGTVSYKGFRFDIGGNRFFSKNAEIEKLWNEILGDRMIERDRLSRIYYRGRFFKYPLETLNVLAARAAGDEEGTHMIPRPLPSCLRAKPRDRGHVAAPSDRNRLRRRPDSTNQLPARSFRWPRAPRLSEFRSTETGWSHSVHVIHNQWSFGETICSVANQ